MQGGCADSGVGHVHRLAEQDAAATSGREAAEEELSKSTARSPYQAPGGRWSNFRTYSVWQVRSRLSYQP